MNPCSFVALACMSLLSLGAVRVQDPVRVDVTPPNPEHFIVGAALEIYASDGQTCKRF